MCIIAYKPQGKNVPSRAILKNCFDNNNDGAGLMYSDGMKVYIKKGFMNFEDFYNVAKGIPSKYPVVYHCRITTHGGTKKGFTHPFPLTDRLNDMKRLSNTCKVGIVHNGIISLTSDAKKESDTTLFIRKYLTRLVKSPKYYTDIVTVDIIRELIDSKMAIMSCDGHVELIGKFIQDSGIYYSNDTYKESYYNKWQKYYKEETKYQSYVSDLEDFSLGFQSPFDCMVNEMEKGDYYNCLDCIHYDTCFNEYI